VLEVERSGEQ